MTTKEIALKTIEQLPEDVSWENIQERINFMVGVHKGLCELDEEKGIAHDKIKEENLPTISAKSFDVAGGSVKRSLAMAVLPCARPSPRPSALRLPPGVQTNVV